MFITFPYKLVRDHSCRFKCVQVRTAGFRYPSQTRVPTRCKRGPWAPSGQALLVVHVLHQHSVVPGTIHCCCCCIMCHTNEIESTKKELRSDLQQQQQQRSSIMMHPSGHPAARRQRRSHAPILSRQPRSTRRYAGRCGSG